MANSWNGPKLGSPIRTDVPELQKKLIALLKQDPTSVANIPSGAKRLVNTSGTQWQVQQYNGSSWAAIGKLIHDVDKLDGYHAAITPNANTVAVRNANKQLEGDITGNAATASSATTLSETLPVNKGGTGATTSAAARTNLGVPPTSHASTATTYGVGNATKYGHLKLSDAVDSASGATGGAAATPAAVKAAKDVADAAQSSADAAMTKASTLATTSTPGIVKPGAGMSVDSAGSLGVNDTVVRTSGSQTVSGPKFNTTRIGWPILQNNVERGNSETTSAGGTYCTYDKNKRYIGALDFWVNKGDSSASLYALNGMDAEDSTRASITVYFKKDGTKYATCPTPPSTSNTDAIATTGWVRKYALPTGALIPSLATSMTGYLLCNGAAVSRTTYADLFALLDTSFGTGNGSTTFNLPDFRNKTLWGASKNLMKVIAAGLPNITGNVFPITYTGASDGTPIGGDGAFKTVTDRGDIAIGKADYFGTGYYPYANFDASRSSKIYGKSTTVQPPAIAVNIFIKY